MQKWCPEAFESGVSVLGSATPAEKEYQSAAVAGAEGTDRAAGFRSESGFTSPQSLLGHLTQKERAQLYDLVEQDVATEYQDREEKLRARLDQKVNAAEANFESALGNISRELEKALTDQLKDISTASARLAVQLAEKIVRKAITVDEEVLARTLETTQYKLLESTSLTVSLNPDEASWIQARPELLKELNIKEVKADRRVERGGCIIKSGSKEWDATIARQLESLSEVVEEAIATAGNEGKLISPEEHDEPELG
jgi:flagellar assembly protein FliH